MTFKIYRFKKWCEKNGLSTTTGYRLINSGAVKALKLGRLTFITSEEDDKWLKTLQSYKAMRAK